MQWKAGLPVMADEAGSPLQQRLRAVEGGADLTLEDSGEEPLRPPRLEKRLSRVGMRPLSALSQASVLQASELKRLCLQLAEQDFDNDDCDDVDIDDAIVRHPQPTTPRPPQRGEWLLMCLHWLHGVWYRYRPPRRRRARRLPRVIATQQGRGAKS
ncbi:hypothetical protein C2134_00600 [Chromobacterium sinusclupearum]|uniref:Uncharacterized protein n=2 Tax=Chromobacterium TaxID=535 RepID=A0A2K4MU05_9NEIS|nr:hypothetical protein C2134_00600 [Chromobacterium sinusclupearum]